MKDAAYGILDLKYFFEIFFCSVMVGKASKPLPQCKAG